MATRPTGSGGGTTVTGVIDVTQAPYNVVANSNGTTGNGTDNRTAINAAYVAAVAANKSLYFPPATGFYRYTSYLDFTSAGHALHVFGGGIDKTKLYNDEVTLVGMQLQNQASVYLHDFTLKKRTAGVRTGSASGVFITGCDGVLFQNVEFDTADAANIYFSNCTKATVLNCVVHDAYDGIHFEDSLECIAIGNMVYSTKDDAIACITNSGTTKLQERVVIADNIVKDSLSRGIVVGGGINVTVTGNSVSNTSGAGIFAETSSTWGDDTHEVVIANNAVTNGGVVTGGAGPHGAGIMLLRSDTTNPLDNVLIANNVITTPRYMFIRIGIATLNAPINRVQIIGNMCIGPVTTSSPAGYSDPGSYPGIVLENVIDALVADNFIERPADRAIVVLGGPAANVSGVTVIRGNTIIKPAAPSFSTGTINCHTSNCVVQGNVLRDPAGTTAATVAFTGTAVAVSNVDNVRITDGPA